MATFEKLERDGNVAVLYSPGYGAGWFTWNRGHEGLLFDKDIVEAVLANDREKAIKLAESKYPDIYTGGGGDLAVTWVPKGSRFEVNEYDGRESVRVFGPDNGFRA